MASKELRALLAAAEDAERRCRKYSRRADLMDKLSFMLLPAFVAITVGLVAYGLYGWRQMLATGLALWFAGYVAYMLRTIYDYKAAKAARQACVFRRTAETAAEIERIMAELEKAAEELIQELEKGRSHRNHQRTSNTSRPRGRLCVPTAPEPAPGAVRSAVAHHGSSV